MYYSEVLVYRYWFTANRECGGYGMMYSIFDAEMVVAKSIFKEPPDS